jgi:hypothetical protein
MGRSAWSPCGGFTHNLPSTRRQNNLCNVVVQALREALRYGYQDERVLIRVKGVRQMAHDYKNWKHDWSAISADVESVDYIMQNNDYEAKAPTASDLNSAAEWLALYAVDEQNEHFQSLLNVIAFLDMTADSKVSRNATIKAKQEYAKQNNIKYSQVRVKKAGN